MNPPPTAPKIPDASVVGASLETSTSETGVAPGVNIKPGSDDDGWIVPPPVRLSDGTLVQLYKDGEALHAAYQAISNAKHRICLEVYIFASDDTGRAFADLLSRKARQGLKVYVIYDSFGSLTTDWDMLDRMARSGVHLEQFHPVRPWQLRYSWRPANRDHRQLLIIDDDIAGLGGLNIGAEYAGSWVIRHLHTPDDPWRDNAIGLRGPSARLFLRSFARTWHYVTHGGPIKRAEFVHGIQTPTPRQSNKTPVMTGDLGILASVPTRCSPLRPLLRSLFNGARESVDMTMAYFAPDDELIDALCRASRRGVRIRLMLPARCDVHLLMVAARSFYEKLLTAGVEIYERQYAVLHAKTMTIDGRISLVGSTNLDYRSIEYNLEISAMIDHREFGRQMQALFDNDVNFATRINLREWRKRPLLDRFGQWCVSRARYLL